MNKLAFFACVSSVCTTTRLHAYSAFQPKCRLSSTPVTFHRSGGQRREVEDQSGSSGVLILRPSRRPAGVRPGPRGATTRMDRVGRAARAASARRQDECGRLRPGRGRRRQTGASVTWSSSGLRLSGSSRLGRGCRRVVSWVVAGLHASAACTTTGGPPPSAPGRRPAGLAPGQRPPPSPPGAVSNPGPGPRLFPRGIEHAGCPFPLPWAPSSNPALMRQGLPQAR
jgi:hypothetical protein